MGSAGPKPGASILTGFDWASAAHMVSGVTAGGVSTVLLFPLDVVKTRLQVIDWRSRAADAPKTTATGELLPQARAYRGLAHAASSLYAENGVRALFRGLPPALLGSTASWGFYFFFYEHAKRHAVRRQQRRLPPAQQPPPLSAAQHLLCGAQAGVVTTFLTNPIWLIKVRMQLQAPVGSGRPYRGIAGPSRRRTRRARGTRSTTAR